ncbi:MAG: NmrA family NAD(P)-binding protein [Gemmatimonadetes bacterium]|nr:NmrA family NAD(P)-binding protein [Gemmatimonadota bacterium]
METLVVGGTGTVGSAVVRALAEKGESVRAMARSPEKARDLPSGVRAIAGDLAKPETLNEAFAGVERVFLLNALGEHETDEGLAGVRAAKTAGAKRIVYMSVAMPPASEIIPHFASKIPVEEAVRDSGMEWTILRPNNFYQNDLRLREPIVQHGVYPQPIGGKGMTRVDVRDIADAAVRALTTGDHRGRIYGLHGPDALTGTETAAIYSRHLGRPVQYMGDDLDAWQKQVRGMMPEWMIRDLRIMYAFFQDHGFEATDEERTQQRAVVGHDPRTFDAFVAEVAQEWKQ